jgi:hypothetical protein
LAHLLQGHVSSCACPFLPFRGHDVCAEGRDREFGDCASVDVGAHGFVGMAVNGALLHGAGASGLMWSRKFLITFMIFGYSHIEHLLQIPTQTIDVGYFSLR